MKVRALIHAGGFVFIETLDGDVVTYDGNICDLEFVPNDATAREAVAEQGIGD